jgi:hypothetical protein
LLKAILNVINKNKGDYHHRRIKIFLKSLSLKDPFGSSVDHDVANKPCSINTHKFYQELTTLIMILPTLISRIKPKGFARLTGFQLLRY